MGKNFNIFLMLFFILISSCSDKKVLPGYRVDVFESDSCQECVNSNLKNSMLDLPKAYPVYPTKVVKASLGKKFPKIVKSTFAPVVNYYDMVIAANYDYVIKAFDINSGRKLWEKELLSGLEKNEILSISGMVINKNTVYVSTPIGKVFAVKFNRDNSHIVWQVDLKQPINSAPSISKDNLIIKTSKNKVFALDLISGKKAFQYNSSQTFSSPFKGSSPAVNKKGDIAVAFSNGEAHMISSKGEFKGSSSIYHLEMQKKSDTSSPIIANPIFDIDRLFVIGSGKSFSAMDLSFFQEAWNKKVSSVNTPCIIKNNVFVLDTNNSLMAFDIELGTLKWKRTLPKDIVFHGPVCYENQLLITNSKGSVLSFEARSSNFLYEKNVSNSEIITPVNIYNNKAIITNKDGEIFIINLKD